MRNRDQDFILNLSCTDWWAFCQMPGQIVEFRIFARFLWRSSSISVFRQRRFIKTPTSLTFNSAKFFKFILYNIKLESNLRSWSTDPFWEEMRYVSAKNAGVNRGLMRHVTKRCNDIWNMLLEKIRKNLRKSIENVFFTSYQRIRQNALFDSWPVTDTRLSKNFHSICINKLLQFWGENSLIFSSC